MFSGNSTWGANICCTDDSFSACWLYNITLPIKGNKRPTVSSGLSICSLRPCTTSHPSPNPLRNRGTTTTSSTPGRASSTTLSHRCSATTEDQSWGGTTTILRQSCQLVQRVFLLSVLTLLLRGSWWQLMFYCTCTVFSFWNMKTITSFWTRVLSQHFNYKRLSHSVRVPVLNKILYIF